jgi:hypothetical protein
MPNSMLQLDSPTASFVPQKLRGLVSNLVPAKRPD